MYRAAPPSLGHIGPPAEPPAVAAARKHRQSHYHRAARLVRRRPATCVVRQRSRPYPPGHARKPPQTMPPSRFSRPAIRTAGRGRRAQPPAREPPPARPAAATARKELPPPPPYFAMPLPATDPTSPSPLPRAPRGSARRPHNFRRSAHPRHVLAPSTTSRQGCGLRRGVGRGGRSGRPRRGVTRAGYAAARGQQRLLLVVGVAHPHHPV